MIDLGRLRRGLRSALGRDQARFGTRGPRRAAHGRSGGKRLDRQRQPELDPVSRLDAARERLKAAIPPPPE